MKTLILNLSNGFKPFLEKNLNENVSTILYEYFEFPGGEPHIKLHNYSSDVDEVIFTLRAKSFNDIGKLLVAVDAVKRNLQPKTISLYMPYFPATRQDRAMVFGEPLTSKVYADVINNLEFSKVIIMDAHSDVAPALINNCINTSNVTFIEKVIEEINPEEKMILISPDAGSNKKVYKLIEEVGYYPTMQSGEFVQNNDGTIEVLDLYKFDSIVKCDKARDLNTGKIIDFEVYTDDLKGKDCLIVDDICDGGGTFKGLAKSLKEKGASKIYLAVSHGIFSKGLEGFENFEKLFCTDSFIDMSESTEKLSIIEHSKLTS